MGVGVPLYPLLSTLYSLSQPHLLYSRVLRFPPPKAESQQTIEIMAVQPTSRGG